MAECNIVDIEDALRRELSIILNVDVASIVNDKPLSGLGLDSMSFVELLVFIEKKFNIKLMQSGLKRDDFYAVKPLAARIAKEMGVRE
jgi:acyl carrier protein